MPDEKTIIPKSGYVPKLKYSINRVNKAINFDKKTKKYITNILNKKIEVYEKKNKKPTVTQKIYNNLFKSNKNKNYGENDLLKDNQYYPPKP